MQLVYVTARLVLAAMLLISGTNAYAQCPREWQPGFNMPGVYAQAMLVFDDGTGEALYVGGSAADVRCPVSKWDGVQWSSAGAWVPEEEWGCGSICFEALAVFDDGSGPTLYGGGSTYGVVRLVDGAWQRLLSGPLDTVSCLAVFDDGNGPALYVGGDFTSLFGGGTIGFIAKWDGQTWSEVGGGVDSWDGWGKVCALAVYDDGRGPALYATGHFGYAGEVAVNNIAKWDGQSWSALGLGISGFGADGYALAVYDPPGPEGPGLYVGGYFWYAGTQAANSVARWDGQSWTPLGAGLQTWEGSPARCRSLGAYDDAGLALYAGGENIVYAGGQEGQNFARWDGSVWTPFVFEDGGPLAQVVYDPPGPEQGPGLYLCGGFRVLEGMAAPGTVRLDESGFSRLGEGLGPDLLTWSICAWDDGTGAAVYVAGQFSTVGDLVARGLARWDGAAWSTVGDLASAGANVLTAYDGPGPLARGLYAGSGLFLAGSPDERHSVMRWDGTAWSSLGQDVAFSGIRAMALHDDGAGPALYVAGDYRDYLPGFQANGVAKWDGVSWSALGSGIGYDDPVNALCSYDPPGPEGPALYVGGDFIDAGGVWAAGLAKWDGESWSEVGGGVRLFGHRASVWALAAFDSSGTGEAAELYVLGPFDRAGDVPAHCFAKWDGQTWAAVDIPVEFPELPPGQSWVTALAVLDLGAGPVLCVAAGNLVLCWDGHDWSTLADGFAGGWVTGLATLAEPGAAALYLVGDLYDAGSLTVTHFAKWGCPSDFALGDLNCDGVVDTNDIDPFVTALVSPSGYASGFAECYRGAADCNADGAVNVFDIDPFVEVLLGK